METLTKEQFFQKAAQFVVDWGADEDHLIATMILLHCYRLTVGPKTQLSDAGNHRELAPITRSHAAEFIANCDRRKRRDKHPRTLDYWEDVGRHISFELASQITPEFMQRVDFVIGLLKAGDVITQAVADV